MVYNACQNLYWVVMMSRVEKKVAVLQSNYIPWKGYFDLIRSVDVFVFYDIVQYTKNDWRNRNKVCVGGESKWLSIPVKKESLGQLINETKVSDLRWADKHWKTISQNYRPAPGFATHSAAIEALYADVKGELYLSDINQRMIKGICDILGVKTELRNAEDFDLPEDRQARLVEICRAVGGNTYVSGPSARNYIDEQYFTDAGLRLEWFDYSGYGEYPQRSANFEHGVSVVDLLLNTGDDFNKYLVRG